MGHGKSQNALKLGRFGTKSGSKKGQKRVFFKNHPEPFGMVKQVFLAKFEPVVTRFGHGNSQNALKLHPLSTKNGSKLGQKRVFPKMILNHLGCSNKCFEPILSPSS